MPSNGFFITGCDRSGTTLLQSTLDGHPQLTVTYETGLFVDLHGRFGRLGRRGEPNDYLELVEVIRRHTQFVDWNPAPLLATLTPGVSFAEVTTGAYASLAEQRGARLWADKAPHYMHHVGFLAQLVPGSRFIHIHRDPRAVVHSLLGQPWGPVTAYHAAHKWHATMRAALSALRSLPAERVLHVCYEDLALDPRRELKRVCTFLGVDFDPGLAAARGRSGSLPSQEHGYHTHLDEPIQAHRTEAWRALPARDVTVVEALCARLMDELGYACVQPRRRYGVGFEARVYYGGLRRWRELRGHHA